MLCWAIINNKDSKVRNWLFPSVSILILIARDANAVSAVPSLAFGSLDSKVHNISLFWHNHVSCVHIQVLNFMKLRKRKGSGTSLIDFHRLIFDVAAVSASRCPSPGFSRWSVIGMSETIWQPSTLRLGRQWRMRRFWQAHQCPAYQLSLPKLGSHNLNWHCSFSMHFKSALSIHTS